MKITICGSIAFFEQMLAAKHELEKMGHEVRLPPAEVKDREGNLIPVKKYYEIRKSETSNISWVWDRKEEAIRAHFSKIEWADAVLVLNIDKNDVKGYVGSNTLIEMGLAFHLRKLIFMMNSIPDISCKEEILGMKPVIINSDFRLVG